MTIILEYADGTYRPLGEAGSIGEAEQIVEAHLVSLDPDRDELPARAAVWERDERGNHAVTKFIDIHHE